MSSLAKLNSEDPVSNYAEIMDDFNKSRHSNPPIDFINKRIDLKFKKTYYRDEAMAFIAMDDDSYVSYSITKNKNDDNGTTYDLTSNYNYNLNGNKVFIKYSHNMLGLEHLKPAPHSRGWYSKTYSQDEINRVAWLDVKIIHENGSKIKLEKYNGKK